MNKTKLLLKLFSWGMFFGIAIFGFITTGYAVCYNETIHILHKLVIGCVLLGACLEAIEEFLLKLIHYRLLTLKTKND